MTTLVNELVSLGERRGEIARDRGSVLHVDGSLGSGCNRRRSGVELLAGIVRGRGFSCSRHHHYVSRLGGVIPNCGNVLGRRNGLVGSGANTVGSCLIRLRGRVGLRTTERRLTKLCRRRHGARGLGEGRRRRIGQTGTGFGSTRFVTSTQAAGLNARNAETLTGTASTSARRTHDRLAVTGRRLGGARTHLSRLGRTVGSIGTRVTTDSVRLSMMGGSSGGGKNNALARKRESGTGGSTLIGRRGRCFSRLTRLGRLCVSDSLVARRRCTQLIRSLRVRRLGERLSVTNVRPSRVRGVGRGVLSTRVGFGRHYERRSSGRCGRTRRHTLATERGQCRLSVRTTTHCRCRGLASRRSCLQLLSSLRCNCCDSVLTGCRLARRRGTSFRGRVGTGELGRSRQRCRGEGRTRSGRETLTRGCASVTGKVTRSCKRALNRVVTGKRLAVGDFLHRALLVTISTLRGIVRVTTIRVATGGTTTATPLSFVNVTGTTTRVTTVGITFTTIGKVVNGFCAKNFANSNR